MKYVLGFEHIRRLPGAHSELITRLGQRLAQRGQDVTILCDSVNDPARYPELRFVARRTFQTGRSHRPALLHGWSVRALDELEYDVVISFHAAIPGDVVFPTFGLALRPFSRRIPSQVQRVDPRQLLARQVARSVLLSPRTRVIGALSEKMADELSASLPQIGPRLRVVRGASPMAPCGLDVDLAEVRSRFRKFLRLSEKDIAFLWAGRVPRRSWVQNMLRAFSRVVLNGHEKAVLVVASEDTWPIHDLAVDFGCDQNLRFVGHSCAIESLLAATDVGLHLRARSNWGRFAWECMACGVPIIAANDAAAVECIRAPDERLAGRFVSGAKTEPLCDGIMAMLDPDVRSATRRAAQSIAPAAQFDGFVGRIESLASELTTAD